MRISTPRSISAYPDKSQLSPQRHVAEPVRRSVACQISIGAILMPLGFSLGGILNSEGDPSLGVALVPIGATVLVMALVRLSRSAH